MQVHRVRLLPGSLLRLSGDEFACAVCSVCVCVCVCVARLGMEEEEEEEEN